MYDQVLDTIMLTGAIPERYQNLFEEEAAEAQSYPIDTYFAMARGVQSSEYDIPAMEMTKWFNTNYHYIVPEFHPEQDFECLSSKIFDEFEEAQSEDIITKPVLIGPVSFLLLGKERTDEKDFHRLDLLDKLLPVYQNILDKLDKMGAGWVQLDEPFLALDLDDHAKTAYQKAYNQLEGDYSNAKLLLTTYFEGLGDNRKLACNLPVDGLHLDLVEAPDQLSPVLNELDDHKVLSLGLIDGRNVWKTDLDRAAKTIQQAASQIGTNRLMVAPSSSLLHCPVDLEQENDPHALPEEVKRWMAFANQKLEELDLLNKHIEEELSDAEQQQFEQHRTDIADKKQSKLVHNPEVQERMDNLDDSMLKRNSSYPERKKKQNLNVPDLYPTTTIGSFPQTQEVRKWRSDYRKGNITEVEYESF